LYLFAVLRTKTEITKNHYSQKHKNLASGINHC
jgi:hypothetical protein